MKELYYLDANALIKYSYYQDLLDFHGKQETGVKVIRSLIENQQGIFYCHHFALLECYHVLLAHYRDNQKCKLFGDKPVKQRHSLELILNQFFSAFKKSDLKLENTPLSAELLIAAQKIILNYGMKTELSDRKKVDSMDMIHIALVKQLSKKYQQSVIIVTSDKAMKTICDYENIPFFDPEIISE
ncbi:hypothetical protein DOJK_00612 [Patescibacteria group bacterium]|nr:hypothetical protein DOJK_00612 [Patescibacteria group bacterium]